jgi:dienelactone hydrolase
MREEQMKSAGLASVVLVTAVLGIVHGAEDPIAPLEEVNKLIKDFRAARVAWQMELYGGTEHGFSTPKNAAEERANTLSRPPW